MQFTDIGLYMGNIINNIFDMDFDYLDYCADCGVKLTENEKHENVDVCHKCFDKAFENDHGY